MKDNLLSIEQASNRLRETLIKYIEATYHISDEHIIGQRNNLLNSPNVVHNSPYIESTPRYQTAALFKDLDISNESKDYSQPCRYLLRLGLQGSLIPLTLTRRMR